MKWRDENTSANLDTTVSYTIKPTGPNSKLGAVLTRNHLYNGELHTYEIIFGEDRLRNHIAALDLAGHDASIPQEALRALCTAMLEDINNRVRVVMLESLGRPF
jgi:hypothetical protein